MHVKKKLIENSIICWNYAYLTNLIAAAESEEQKGDSRLYEKKSYS